MNVLIFFFNNINLLIPSPVFTENSGFFLNLEGRVRRLQKILTPPVRIFKDWELAKGFIVLKRYYLDTNFSIFNNFFKISSYFKDLVNYGCIFFINFNTPIDHAFYFKKSDKKIDLPYLNSFTLRFINSIFIKYIFNYYTSDIYSRNSQTLGLCARRVKISNFLI